MGFDPSSVHGSSREEMYMKLFQVDSEFNQVMTRGFDLLILNLLFLICCLPVVTIGASCAALHTISLKYAEGLEPYIFRDFFAAFRKNFKQATLVWILMFVTGAFLYVDTGMALNGGAGGKVMLLFLFCMELLYLFIAVYIFPLIARYDNSIRQHLKNAVLLAIREFKTTVLFSGIILAWFLIGMYAPEAFLLAWMIFTPLLGFSLRAVFQDKILLKIFESYEP